MMPGSCICAFEGVAVARYDFGVGLEAREVPGNVCVSVLSEQALTREMHGERDYLASHKAC